MLAQITSHGTTLTWVASSGQAACSPTSVPACSNFGYNIFKSTSPGGEGATPINSSLISTNTYFDSVTLTTSVQTFYYTVEAVETLAGFGTLNSPPSVEVSGTFPALLAPPTGVSATVK